MELPSLPARPKAEVISVSEILQYARSGRFRVPSFQTGLRWGARHVEALFDSLLRGFPVGGLLLWQRPSEAGFQTFGPVCVDAPRLGDALFVVDGQQRITALVGAMLHPDAAPLGGAFAIWVDLLTSAFATMHEAPGPHWIPLNVIGDRKRLHQWARSLQAGEATEALVARAFEIEETLTKYEMPAYIVREATPQALRLIFSRVNTYGVALKEAEVFQAMFGDEGGQPKPLDQLATELAAETGFGALNGPWLLRCVKAVGGLDAREEFTEEDNDAAPRLVAETRAALRHAIGFLQREAQIVHASLLPYRFPLIVLAKLFHLYPALHPRNRTLLVRWIWRGALSGVHGDSSHHAVNAHLADLGANEHEDIQRLLSRVPKQSSLPDPNSAWNGHAAATRLLTISLLRLGPCQPDTDLPFDPDALNRLLSERDLGELFKRVFKDGENPFAARIFWPQHGRVRLESRSPEFLFSHAIPPDAQAALQSGDIARFQALRAESMRANMRQLVELLASPDADDRPALHVLLAS